ncbi:MAG: GNAT family N-acetyltransferase [Siphonobacter sp.]
MDLLIRPAQPNDLANVMALYQSALEDPILLSKEEATATFQQMKNYPDYTLYVAENNGSIVGTFALLIMDNLGHYGAKSGIVEDVAVRPDQQGKGIGKALMLFALERCREKKCYKMALSSNLKREKTHAFYESLGFKKHGFSFLTELS